MKTTESNPPLAGGHWSDIAKQWSQVGPPLRPSPEDIDLFTAVVEKYSSDVAELRALILGVTPELYHLKWPRDAKVLAVDHTKAMIDVIWPATPQAVICGQWTDLPLETGSVDLALCDGGFQLLSHPDGQARLVRSLHRILAPAGCCVFRLFVPPEKKETADEVLADLSAAKISNLNILKLRLAMAMQIDAGQGVQLANVWNEIHRVEPDFPALAARLGWTLEHLLAINTYRDCAKRYHFLNVAGVCEMFCQNPGGFAVERFDVPSYELGERCPTIVFRRI
jgi:SAM-dependent methyltransferase